MGNEITKKRILFINSVCYGSTGRICTGLYDLAEENGYECCIAYGRDYAPAGYNTIKIGNKIDLYAHVLKTRLFDKHGFGSKAATKKFLKQIETYKPDIIHLHNIHGYYINIEYLFTYLKKNPQIKVVWTLHDCWAFTGHCANFIHSKCMQWKNNCKNCRFLLSYPCNIGFANSEKNFTDKKRLFTACPNITVVVPSFWLKGLVESSFLKEYKSIVMHNGIDASIFKKVNVDANNKATIILGVANVWNEKKGFEVFLQLAQKLDKQDYQIILVGLSKKQIKNLPTNIKGIERTNNVEELVELYNSADVFFNPTLEDNYPTVNLEAQACGLPVVTFDSGGSKETIYDKNCYVVNNLDEFLELLNSVDFKNINCQLKKEKYDKTSLFNQYIKLYEEISQ